MIWIYVRCETLYRVRFASAFSICLRRRRGVSSQPIHWTSQRRARLGMPSTKLDAVQVEIKACCCCSPEWLSTVSAAFFVCESLRSPFHLLSFDGREWTLFVLLSPAKNSFKLEMDKSFHWFHRMLTERVEVIIMTVISAFSSRQSMLRFRYLHGCLLVVYY